MAYTYVAEVFGWMTIIEADTKREAVSVAKARAPMASLLPTDVNDSHLRRATTEDIDWYRTMCGS